MQTSVQRATGDATVLTVTGEVDLSTAAELRSAGERALAELAAPPSGDGADGRLPELVVDLGGVTFLDSSGLGALVAIRKAAAESAHRVVIANPSVRVRQVIGVCGLGPQFGLSPEPPADPAAPIAPGS